MESEFFRPEKTLCVERHHAKLEEGGVKLDLTVVRKFAFLHQLQMIGSNMSFSNICSHTVYIQIDTPGFGDVVDNSNCWQPITGDLEIEKISDLQSFAWTCESKKGAPFSHPSYQ